jgi:hypothetical protein
MAMQVRPSQARNIALAVRAVVLQQQSGVLEDFGFLEFDSEVVIDLEEVACRKFLIWFLMVIRKNDMVRLSPAMRAGFGLVQCSHSN